MLCLILGILIIAYLMVSFVKKWDDEYGKELCQMTLFIIGVIILVAMVIVLCPIISSRNLDEKIKMYKEENQKIEAQIDVVVQNYMNYESSTFKDIKIDTSQNSMVLVSLYPELKSDELMKAQIKTYQKNNDAIKKLKEKKIDVKANKWWLYFGK